MTDATKPASRIEARADHDRLAEERPPNDRIMGLIVLGLLVGLNAWLWLLWSQRGGLLDPRPDPSRSRHSRPIVERDGRKLLWARENGDGTVEWFDITGATIDARQLQFGIGADRIASIDRPQFARWGDPRLRRAHLDRRTLVVGVEIDGDARAYPLLTLHAHELVNDTVAGKPVTVGY